MVTVMTKLIDVGSIVYSRMVVDNGDIFVPLKDISYAVAIDSVTVVRCKDCRYYDNHYGSPYRNHNDDHIGDCMQCNHFVGDDDYCSFGERKDDEQYETD